MTLKAPYTGSTQLVLHALAECKDGATATELARMVPSVSRRRIADVLAAQALRGVVVREGNTGRYVPLNGTDPVVTEPAGPPPGWGSPRVVLEGDAGEAYSGRMSTADPDERELMGIWKLDPAVWAIDGSLGVSAWQAFNGEWLYAYKARVVRRVEDATQLDLEALLKRAARPVRTAVKTADGPETFCVFLSDFQIGKSEGGGSEATVERVLGKLALAEDRLRDLRKLGRQVGTIAIFGLGDIVEGCTGFYAMQEFSVDLDRRAQMRVARELIFTYIQRLAPLADRLIVGSVGGNHGENRTRKGKAFTTFADNDDVAVFEQLAFVCDQSEAYRHVQFLVPDEDLVLTVDLGQRLAIAHGHQFTKGANPTAKAEEWLRGQAIGNLPAGSADILVSGHYHHAAVHSFGPRWWFQVPALDGGSAWFANTTGSVSPTGLLTFVVGKDGWRDLAIL